MIDMDMRYCRKILVLGFTNLVSHQKHRLPSRKDKSFQTEEHGTVSHDRIRKICTDRFGTEIKRSNSIRYLEFDLHRLEKAKEAYLFPEKVTILQKNVSESGSDASDRDRRVSAGEEDVDNGNNHEGNSPIQKENGSTNEEVLPAETDQNASPASPQGSSTLNQSNDTEQSNNNTERDG
jgi:hypothetical protein